MEDVKADMRVKAKPFFQMPVSRSAMHSMQFPHAVPCTVIREWNDGVGSGNAWVVRFDNDLYLGGDKHGPGPWRTEQMIYAREMEPLEETYDRR